MQPSVTIISSVIKCLSGSSVRSADEGRRKNVFREESVDARSVLSVSFLVTKSEKRAGHSVATRKRRLKTDKSTRCLYLTY